MTQIPVWLLVISFCFIGTTNSLEDDVRDTLINFLGKLTGGNGQLDPSYGWNSSSDPCINKWKGVECDTKNSTVEKLFLDQLNLAGTLDVLHLCNDDSLSASLSVLTLDGNHVGGEIQSEIGSCKSLTRLHLRGNKFFGNLPDTLSLLSNLKRLDISNNSFSGYLPDLGRISGLTMFLAQYNHLTGLIPNFDFSNLRHFNVSYNNFSGPIPYGGGRFPESCFLGNPDLCGDPLPRKCPRSLADKSDGVSGKQTLMYSGYVLLGLIVISFIVFKLCKSKQKDEKPEEVNKVAAVNGTSTKKVPSPVSSDYKSGMSRSEFSGSAESALISSSSLVILTSPVVNGLKFEDLLKAPAELLGRGRHSSLYKVSFENGMTLVVKRIKDWAISNNDFKHMMERLDQVKHPNVLPAVAFYCSKQEKLLVYEYQQNGSLFRLLHGSQMGQAFDWGRRLTIATSIAEALAFMHQELREDGIAHGNLKSSNIILNQNMEPCISEYGLITMDQEPSSLANASGWKAIEATSAFRVDIYGFGVILLELLTGKLVQSNGVDLTKWVHSVVREEWTAEVFDKSLFSEDASEERMVSLLLVAIKCVNPSPQARPGINQVAVMINTIKEEEERSAVYEV